MRREKRSPVEGDQPVRVVDPIGRRLERRKERLPVPRKDGPAIRVGAGGQALRFTAGHRHVPQRLRHVRERRFIAIGRRGEHESAAVRAPGRGDGVAARSPLPAEPGPGHQPRAGEHVLWLRPGLERLDDERRTAIVEPPIPIANREAVVHAGIPLAVPALGRDPPVVVVGARARVDVADHGDRAAVGPPQRRARAGGQVRDPLRFPAVDHVDDVDLRRLVTVAPRGEGDAAAVAAPGGPALGRARRGQPPGDALPSVGTSQRSLVWSRSSYAGSVTWTAAHLPSGLTTGAPSRFASQTSS